MAEEEVRSEACEWELREPRGREEERERGWRPRSWVTEVRSNRCFSPSWPRTLELIVPHVSHSARDRPLRSHRPKAMIVSTCSGVSWAMVVLELPKPLER